MLWDSNLVKTRKFLMQVLGLGLSLGHIWLNVRYSSIVFKITDIQTIYTATDVQFKLYTLLPMYN